MYATLTTLTFKSPADRDEATRNLAALLPQARQLDGFGSLAVIAQGEAMATMVTLYTSEAAAASAADQLRPHLTVAVGPHLVGPPERAGGAVLLHS